MIPEGTYLEMCDNLKQVHRNLPKPGENNSRRVPFMPHDPLDLAESDSDSDEDDESWQPDWYEEWAQNEQSLRRLLDDLKVANRTLRTLKPIQRITKRIKEDALRSYCRQANFYPDEMTEWTYEKFVEIATLHNWPENNRDKRFERTIYENYRIHENRMTMRKKNETMELKRNLENEISFIRDRQDYLRVNYNL
jgi:hypothetical protein